MMNERQQHGQIGVSCNVPAELWQIYRNKRHEVGGSYQSLVIEAIARFCGEDVEHWMKNRRRANVPQAGTSSETQAGTSAPVLTQDEIVKMVRNMLTQKGIS